MKDTKIKERFENAVEAFFDNEKLAEINVSNFDDAANFNLDESESFFNLDESESFFGKYKTFFKYLKQIFLFLPGTYFLFFLTTVVTGYFILPTPIGVKRHFVLPLLAIFIFA